VEELHRTLSTDAMYCLRFLMNCPEPKGEDGAPLPPRLIRGFLTQRLREQGWGWNRIWATKKELKEAAAVVGR
jgi:hypothetical protein